MGAQPGKFDWFGSLKWLKNQENKKVERHLWNDLNKEYDYHLHQETNRKSRQSKLI